MDSSNRFSRGQLFPKQIRKCENFRLVKVVNLVETFLDLGFLTRSDPIASWYSYPIEIQSSLPQCR